LEITYDLRRLLDGTRLTYVRGQDRVRLFLVVRGADVSQLSEPVAAIGRVLFFFNSLKGDMTTIYELFDRPWCRPISAIGTNDGVKPAAIRFTFNTISEQKVARRQFANRENSPQLIRPYEANEK
jgi:hypothetical protein